MKEEQNGASKNKFRRIFRKKWFFPALYLTIAALLLTVVVWYQNVDNQIPDEVEENETADGIGTDPYNEDAEAVMDQQEVIKMPVKNEEQAEIVTKFYDYNADEKDQESGLILYNNRYYQSTGIDIASAEGEPFDVIASLSGTITEVKEDPLLGNVVVISHENDVDTYYASLGEVDVKANDKIKQGDKIGTAGKNLFGQDSGTHVQFEIRKNDMQVNPEDFFNQPLSKLDNVKTENDEAAEEEVEKDTSKEEDASEEQEGTDEEQEAPGNETDEGDTDKQMESSTSSGRA
ncbi:peptidoglycan DD-metalloendopeptidase family protein [Virgibacillus sp. W0181]|uniref:peptidoglycan DD-metalloendopeptidase family protein n=1 Tax=Virgibacillus sp. W0181 TaxID=3391581 RepID=UPI003F466B34